MTVDLLTTCHPKEPWMVEVPVKDLRHGKRTTSRVPVILPHELLNWLSENKRFFIHPDLIKQFWERWKVHKPTHPAMHSGHHCPVAICGDDARYTLGGAKVIVIGMSLVLLDRMKMRTTTLTTSPLDQQKETCLFFFPQKSFSNCHFLQLSSL